MKIAIVGHFGKMMPLLIGWFNESDPDTRDGALKLLMEIASLTWPRSSQVYDLMQSVLSKSSFESAYLHAQGSQKLNLQSGLLV